LEEVTGLELKGGLEELAPDFHGSTHPNHADLLRLALNRHIQFFAPQVDLPAALDEHILRVEDDVLDMSGSALDTELRYPAANGCPVIGFLDEQADPFGHVHSGELSERRAHITLRDDHGKSPGSVRHDCMYRVAGALDHRARVEEP